MKKIVLLPLLFLSLLYFVPFTPGLAQDQIKPVYIIPISGKVGPAMSSFVKRAVAKANKEKVETIITTI